MFIIYNKLNILSTIFLIKRSSIYNIGKTLRLEIKQIRYQFILLENITVNLTSYIENIDSLI